MNNLLEVKNDIKKRLGDILPGGWTMSEKGDAELLIQSPRIRLHADPMSNDPLGPLYGPCVIWVLIMDRVPPEEIAQLREKNAALIGALPPQESKCNLNKWQKDNADTLKTIHSEPTHYDDNYSYRIECRRAPYEKPAHAEYSRIMSALNTICRAYP
jgi:hypothetical protein